jgi:hypothetical protein
LDTEVTIEGANWEYASELALLDEAMEMTTEVFRGEETKKMINAIDVSVDSRVSKAAAYNLSETRSANSWNLSR